MNSDYEYSLHPFEEREFRERFLPAVQGDEPIVRELLDAANAAGPSWTALHKMFDETRVSWLQAVENEDGGAALRTIFPSFARLLSHLRPVHIVKGFSLSAIDRHEFPDLIKFINSAGVLLCDEAGETLPGIPSLLPSRVPIRCLPGRSGGGVILKKDVRPCLEQFRKDMPRLAEWATAQGKPAEPGITIILAALVRAKLKGSAVIEGADVLAGDIHVPKTHRLTFDKPQNLAPAVVREAAKLFGREIPIPKAPEPEPEPVRETVQYTPQGSYELGQQLQHKSFGQGRVIAILDSRRLRVQFAEIEKILIQGLAPRNHEPPTPDETADDADKAADDADETTAAAAADEAS